MNDFDQASDISGSSGKTAVNEKKDTTSSYTDVVACDMDILKGNDVTYENVVEMFEELNDSVETNKSSKSVLSKPYEETLKDSSSVPTKVETENIAVDVAETVNELKIETVPMLIAPMEKLEINTCVGFSFTMKGNDHEAYISRCPILNDNSCPVNLDPKYNCVSTKINLDNVNISSILKL
tara:strand:+ start:337 stop:879 length:543 start_codon:yes stop_codon:yes gene_type:complete